MTTSNKGIDLLLTSEGKQIVNGLHVPYKDISKIATIGYGATFYENGLKVRITDKPITETRARELFKFHLQTFEKELNERLKVTVNQNLYDSLVSLTFNVGITALTKLIKQVNSKDSKENIIEKFKMFKYSSGKVVPGLIYRRNKEVQHFEQIKNIYSNPILTAKNIFLGILFFLSSYIQTQI